MRADVPCRPRFQASLDWVLLLLWGVFLGCATSPGPMQFRPYTPPEKVDAAVIAALSGLGAAVHEHSPDDALHFVDSGGIQSDPGELQRDAPCVAMICRDPDDLSTCYCPATLPDGRRQPLSREECDSSLEDPGYEHQFDSAGGLSGGGKGERGRTARSDGTDNPFKHTRPHPTKKDWIQQKDSHTGQWTDKPAPPGWREWWDARKKP